MIIQRLAGIAMGEKTTFYPEFNVTPLLAHELFAYIKRKTDYLIGSIRLLSLRLS
jgi:hypothetical protein